MNNKKSLSTHYLVKSENLIILTRPTTSDAAKESSSVLGNITNDNKVVNLKDFKNNLGKHELSKLHDLWKHEQFAICELRITWLFQNDRITFKNVIRYHLSSPYVAERTYFSLTDLLLDYFPSNDRKAYVQRLARKYPKSPWIRDLIQTKNVGNI